MVVLKGLLNLGVIVLLILDWFLTSKWLLLPLRRGLKIIDALLVFTLDFRSKSDAGKLKSYNRTLGVTQ